MRAYVLVALLGLTALHVLPGEPLPGVPPEAAKNAEVYGQYPLGYKEIVTQWLHTRLIDPDTAVVEFITEPKIAELAGKNGERLFGYLVEYRVNSRNKFGAYTGMQKKGALIRNGEVIKAPGYSF